MKYINLNAVEQFWENTINKSQKFKVIRYAFGIVTVVYLIVLLYFGYDEIKNVPILSILKGLIPSIFLYLGSLILQMMAWSIIFYGKIKINAKDIYIYAFVVLMRRLPGGFWHWAGRSTLYNRIDNISLKETTLSSFIEWAILLSTGFAAYFIVQKNVLSLIFLIAAFIFAEKWFKKKSSQKKNNNIMAIFLILIYMGSWIIGGLILAINGNVLTGIDVSISHYLESWFLSSSISMIIIFLPAGFGIREVTLSLILKPLLGISYSVLLAVMVRIIFIISELIWGFLGFVFFKNQIDKKSTALQNNPDDELGPTDIV